MEKNLSVIFPSYNSGEQLIRCLKAAKLELKDHEGQYEILVVDSSPTAPQLPDISNLKLIHSKAQLFPSEARNLGARMASYPILVFIDSDVELLPGSLSKLLVSFKDDIAVLGGVYETKNPHTSEISTFQDLFLLYRFKNIPPEGNYFSSAQFAVSKENFLKVGGFSENLKTYEDVDLGFKFQKNSLRAHVVLESRGYHLKSFNLKSIFMDYYLKSRNMIYYRLAKINDLHLCNTFVPSRIRLSYFLVFCYIILFAMLAIPNGPVPLYVELAALLLLLIIDLVLLGDLLRFFWDKTCRPIFVLKSFLLFKATTLPIICGTLGGLINYLIQDESCLNKTKSSSDIVVTNPTQYNK
ncbi:MAG: glycosyltransferase [Nitrospina sp.]|nr:glycosyltransferase [Nitrospina sp.]